MNKINYNRKSYIQQALLIENELKTLFKSNEAITIFDIGACEGEDTIKYSRLFPFSKIYAFEPLPSNIELIQKNFLQYNIQNAVYNTLALSFKNGTAEFYVSSGQPDGAEDSDWDFGNKSSSLLQPASKSKMPRFLRFDKKIEVKTMTLYSFCKNNNIGKVDFIHMDVQGAELMVLEGAEEFISSIRAIWLEVSKAALYKNQPLIHNVQKFMKKNKFFLVKNCLDGIQGDQLYLSSQLFKEYQNLFPEIKLSKSFYINGVVNKLNHFIKTL